MLKSLVNAYQFNSNSFLYQTAGPDKIFEFQGRMPAHQKILFQSRLFRQSRKFLEIQTKCYSHFTFSKAIC